MEEFRILSEKRNELLGRKEIRAVFTKAGATPSKADVKKELAKHAKSKEDHIELRHVYQKYGKMQSEIIADIYDVPLPKAETAKAQETADAAEKPAEEKKSE